MRPPDPPGLLVAVGAVVAVARTVVAVGTLSPVPLVLVAQADSASSVASSPIARKEDGGKRLKTPA